MKISSSFTCLCLKIVGGVMVISSIVDYLVLIMPPNFKDIQWQISTASQLVDRGIVPIVGVTLLIIGWWLNDNTASCTDKPIPALRVSVFIFASIIGLMYFIVIPLHLSNVNQASSQLLTQIEQQAQQQEKQIQAFTAQLQEASKNPAQMGSEISQLDKIIQEGKIQGRQLEEQQLEMLRTQRDNLKQLLDLSKKPDELQARLKEIESRMESEIDKTRSEQENKAKSLAFQQGLQTAIRSLLLTIVYSCVGWFGLRNITTSPKTVNS
jgi:predicted PurR-regulated permease PerM